MIYYYACMYNVHISVHIGLYYILLQILCKCIMSKCNRSTYYELPIINYKNLQLSLAISVSSTPINRTAVMIRIVPNMSVRQVGLSNTVTQVESKGLMCKQECLMSMSPMFAEISSPGPKTQLDIRVGFWVRGCYRHHLVFIIALRPKNAELR